MLTLKQARRIQREAETKAILKFLVLAAIVGITSFLLFYFTDLGEVSSLFYLIPAALILYIGHKIDIFVFFTPREFTGEVIRIHIYRTSDRRVKGANWGTGSNSIRRAEAEIIVRNEKGKTMLRVYPSGDTASRLAEGDKVAFMRFLDEPIVIKGAYWKGQI